MGTVENPHAGQGMVVLDIGGDIGALIVTTAEAMADVEIEICPAGMRDGPPDDGAHWWQGSWRNHHPHRHSHHHTDTPAWPHVAVLARPQGERVVYAAVYPGLRQGRYELWQRPDEPTALTVEVEGGTVTSARWPGDVD